MSKVVIITGASSGIGKGLATLYATAGYDCGLIARRESKLIELKKELEKTTSANVTIGVCDVSKKDAIITCIEDMIDHFGRVDVLIANAGISLASPAYKTTTDHFEKTIQINVLGAGYCAYAVIPTMIKQQSGQIAVISSLAGYRGLPEAGAYCASKSAVNALFESMRLDLKKHSINVSIIRPGYIKSPITNRNEFYMPFLQNTDVGCKKIFRAIQKKRKIFAFPWPLAQIVQTFYFLPCWLYDLCLAGVRNKKRNV